MCWRLVYLSVLYRDGQPSPNHLNNRGNQPVRLQVSLPDQQQGLYALSEVWTKDIQFDIDSSDLGQYSGKTSGLEQTVAAVKKSAEDAKLSGLVTNLLVLDMITPKKTRVNT